MTLEINSHFIAHSSVLLLTQGECPLQRRLAVGFSMANAACTAMENLATIVIGVFEPGWVHHLFALVFMKLTLAQLLQLTCTCLISLCAYFNGNTAMPLQLVISGIGSQDSLAEFFGRMGHTLRGTRQCSPHVESSRSCQKSRRYIYACTSKTIKELDCLRAVVLSPPTTFLPMLCCTQQPCLSLGLFR